MTLSSMTVLPKCVQPKFQLHYINGISHPSTPQHLFLHSTNLSVGYPESLRYCPKGAAQRFQQSVVLLVTYCY
jgi:hypothetical protein